MEKNKNKKPNQSAFNNGRSYPVIINVDEAGVSAINNKTGDVSIISPDKTISIKNDSTTGQNIEMDVSEPFRTEVSKNTADISTNTTDISTNTTWRFDKVLKGYQTNGTHDVYFSGKLEDIDFNSTFTFVEDGKTGSPFQEHTWVFITTNVKKDEPLNRTQEVRSLTNAPRSKKPEIWMREITPTVTTPWELINSFKNRIEGYGINGHHIGPNTPTEGCFYKCIDEIKNNIKFYISMTFPVHSGGDNPWKKVAYLTSEFANKEKTHLVQTVVVCASGDIWRRYISGEDIRTKDFEKINDNSLKIGDYRISSNAVKSCEPNELPCNMGLLTLDVETYPELAEVYGVTEGTFKAAITAGDFVRNVGGNAKPLNEHQEATFKKHSHALMGVQPSAIPTGGIGNLTGGVDKNPWKSADGYSPPNGRAVQPESSATETRSKNTTKNFFEIVVSTYNYEAYTEHKDAELQMVYGWDEETKEYVYKTESPINFIESTKDKIVYWVERADLCTSIKPLEVKEGFAICMENDKWEYKEDHRDEIVYLKVDGSPFTIEKIGKIDSKYTTITPPANVQYYKFTDKWELNEDTRNTLIEDISSLVKSHTKKAIEDELWTLPEEVETKFESEYEQFRYNSIEEALVYITSLVDKTMEELIDLLK